MASRLNVGLDIGGNPIGLPTSFLLGVGVNPVAVDLDNELRRFAWKVEAGAHFAITQPIFAVAQFADFLERIRDFRIPIVAGIWPLVSYRNAEFMANEVPGVVVPPALLERMKKASREAQLNEGLAIAQEMIAILRPMVQGVQISAPFGKVELALRILHDTGCLEQLAAY